MSVRSIEGLQHYLRRLCDEAVPPDDAVLLQRFVAAADRARGMSSDEIKEVIGASRSRKAYRKCSRMNPLETSDYTA
jgi:hypothetical protein